MNKIKEGDLYKVVKISDISLEIRYGYYEFADRFSIYNEPIPIYPTFEIEPLYTKEGFPLVTKIQNKCKYYIGDFSSDECYGCKYLNEVEEMLGICECPYNRFKNV